MGTLNALNTAVEQVRTAVSDLRTGDDFAGRELDGVEEAVANLQARMTLLNAADAARQDAAVGRAVANVQESIRDPEHPETYPDPAGTPPDTTSVRPSDLTPTPTNDTPATPDQPVADSEVMAPAGDHVEPGGGDEGSRSAGSDGGYRDEGSAGGADWSRFNAEQLRGIAADEDVSGRSSMNREELEVALNEKGASPDDYEVE
jgi:hypothetical protein